MESGASPNPRNSAEELTGYPARRDKRVAAGTLIPGPITRRETAVCHKWHVRWCERGRKPPTRLAGHGISVPKPWWVQSGLLSALSARGKVRHISVFALAFCAGGWYGAAHGY